MDLLATVRKEGSRGGRGDFKWSDVQTSSHRENYLGHSVMAPVGRWQKGRDLNWYSKGDGDGDVDAAEQAARERKEELRRVKEAEQDAMARALGLPVPDRTNANFQEVSDKRDLNRIVKELIDNGTEEGGASGGKGVGFNGISARDGTSQVLMGDTIQGTAGTNQEDKELQYALREYKRRHGEQKSSSRRSRSRSRDREKRRNRHNRDRAREHGRHGSHSRTHYSSSHRREEEEEQRRRRSRSRSRERQNRDTRRRERSRSPYRRDGDRVERRRR